MIRRGFWLTAGAMAGIYGYRRVSAVTRRVSASLNSAGLGPTGHGASLARGAGLAHQGRRRAIRMARESYRFGRDVREGMELYRLAHTAPAGPTLSTDRSTDRSTDHEPEDGH